MIAARKELNFSKWFWSNLNATLIVTLIITCLLFNFLIVGHYFDTNLSPDEKTYNGVAVALINNTAIAYVDQYKIDIGQEVTPFYSILVASVYLINQSKKSLIVFQVLLNCSTIILIFLTLKKLIGTLQLSFIVAFVFIFYFPLWAYNYYIMMEVPTVFLLSLFIYFFNLFFYKNKFWLLYVAVITFSLLVLMNNRFIVLLNVFLLYLGYLSLIKYKLRFMHFLYSLLIVLLVITPWFVRQYNIYGQIVFFTPLWHNVVAKNVGLLKPLAIKSIEERQVTIKPISYDEQLKYLLSTGYRKSGTFTLAKYEELLEKYKKGNIYLGRFRRYFLLYDRDYKFPYPGAYRLVPPSSTPFKIVQLVFLLPILIMSLVGILFTFRNKHKLLMLLVLFFVSHVFLHVLIHYIDRYRLTILPVLVILSSYGFSESHKILKSLNKKYFLKFYNIRPYYLQGERFDKQEINSETDVRL
jgi:hypothetical protein